MARVAFLIDGFNLYHSTREVQLISKKSTKWLNVKQMLYAYHMIYSQVAGSTAELGQIYYFSAFAHHREVIDPGVVARHSSLLSCFADSGIIIQMNQFKKKEITCPNCRHKWSKHEEKETDVAIAVKLIELFVKDLCDLAVIVSGDTDIAPAVKTAKQIFPNKKTIFAFPALRKNESLQKEAPGSFKIGSKMYCKHQFPDPYICSIGKVIRKPESW